MKQDFPLMSTKPSAWNYELLADYVDGLVDDATRKRIEDELTHSEEAAMVVAGIKEYYAQRGADRDELELYLNQLAITFSELAVSPKVRKLRFSPFAIRVAAVIVLLMAFVPIILWLIRPSALDSHELIAAHLEKPYKILPHNRDQSEVVDLNHQAYEAYRKANYSQAIEYLQMVLAENPQRNPDSYDTFVLGLSYLYANEYTLASHYLQQVIEGRHPRFEQQAYWFLALAYFQGSEIEKSREILDKILSTQGHYKQADARILLKSLN